MEPKREPKWSPKASQDGTKKEKKSEAKLRELSEALETKNRNERRSGLSSYESAGGGKGRPVGNLPPLRALMSPKGRFRAVGVG